MNHSQSCGVSLTLATVVGANSRGGCDQDTLGSGWHSGGGPRASGSFLPAGRPAHRSSVVFQEPFGNGRTEEGVALFRFADRRDQVLRGGLLYQVTGSPGVRQLLHILVVAVRRKDEHLGFGAF